MPKETKYIFQVKSSRQVRPGQPTSGPATNFAYYNDHNQLYVAQSEERARVLAEQDGLIIDEIRQLREATEEETTTDRIPSAEDLERIAILWDNQTKAKP